MTRWLGARFGACEGQAYGGNGGGEEHGDAQVADDVAQHGRRQVRGKRLADRIVHPICRHKVRRGLHGRAHQRQRHPGAAQKRHEHAKQVAHTVEQLLARTQARQRKANGQRRARQGKRRCQRQAHTYYPAFLYKNKERVYLKNKVINPHLARLGKDEDPYDPQNYKRFEQEEYANDLIFDELMSFVDENKQKPFFLMWTTPLPHVSLQAPERWVQHYVKKFGDEEPYTGKAGYGICRYPHATYAAMISYFDEQVGKLIQKLKAENLYDNTLIIFTSDNGPTFNGGSDSPWFNSGGWFKSEYGWGKCFLHEGGIRVPAVMVWKDKIKPGSETDHICCFQDVMPTLAEIISVTCPPTDGISFLPTLLGNKAGQKEHEYLYWEYPDPKIGNKAIRMGKWKGIITNIRQGNTEMQLYDLDADLREEHDVAAQHPDIVAKFRQLMEESSTPDPNRVGL